MGKLFDEMSKSLASGVSRRTTLKRFATGVTGALMASALPGRGALAQGTGASEPQECQVACRDAGLTGRAFGACVSQCATCLAHGGQIYVANGSGPHCFPV